MKSKIQKHYYRTNDGKGWFCLRKAIEKKDSKLIEVTKEEWDAHKAALEQKRKQSKEETKN